MVDRAKLESEHARAVKREEAKAGGIRDGFSYRVKSGKGYRWYQLSLTFYPNVQWWVEELSGIGRAKILPGTKKKLTDAFKAKLESWL